MIKKLKYDEIDFSKYKVCFDHSVQRNIYGITEVLDLLCDSWELLIYGDYEFVMPIPIKNKFGLKIVLMPLFCQQLGVFGAEINEDIELQFLNYLQKNYNIYTYAFNHQNLLSQNLNRKKDYFIESKEYDLLRKGYSKGRKSAVKTAQNLLYEEVQLSDHLEFIKIHFKGLNKKGDIEQFFSYLNFLKTENRLKLFASFKENVLISIAIVIDDEGCMSLLGLVNDEHYRNDNGASFLIDRILKENISQKSFDFMGGSIRGIEVFFKSFGSVLQEYPFLQNTKKDLLKNIFKK